MASTEMTDRPVLVAPDGFKGTFRATEVAAAIFAMPDVDGGLIGGASLVAKDFIEIVRAAT